ncbi:MAG: PilZ domain-containing protein [Magnetococcales bacterium]|nr:PilZ domain-containing protein [Magnetococcales bacterium]
MPWSIEDTFFLRRKKAAFESGKGAVADDRRGYPRPRFVSRAILHHVDSGENLFGLTEDVSYRGILFAPRRGQTPLPGLVTGALVSLQISLDDFSPVEACYVALNARIIRVEEKAIAMNLVADDADNGAMPNPTRLFIRRQDGCLEGDWELTPPGASLPPALRDRLNHYEQRYARRGPVVLVCQRHVRAGEEPEFRVHNIQYLKELQKLAHLEEEHDRFFAPPGF